MNSGKNFYKSSPDKKAKIKSKKAKKISNQENSEKDNENENNILNKKKKREENEQDKIEINQNMYNQYNIYQRLYVSPIEMQIQQINNQNTNYPELYQNIYYINNPYEFFNNQREMETYPNEEEKIKDIKEIINNMFKRGITNNIIGAFFIEECKNYAKSIEQNEKSVNNIDNNSEENELSNGNKEVIKENNRNHIDKKKYSENNQENDINGNNISKESKLKKPILIW